VTVANLGHRVATAWEETMDKFRALEGDPFAWPKTHEAGIRRGRWRGVVYVKMWDFRTGEIRWREL
jgi:hypothetical protein